MELKEALASDKECHYRLSSPPNSLEEIAFLKKLDKYVARVSRPQIQKIKHRLEADYSYLTAASSLNTLPELSIRLSRSISAYLGVYRNAFDYQIMLVELENAMSEALPRY